MSTTNERIGQLEDEVRSLKAQLEQTKARGGIEKELFDALKNMPDGTVYRTVRDMQTKILRFDYLSGTWEKISGVTVDESIADIRNVFRYIVPEDLKRLMQQIDESLDPLTNFSFEFRYNHPVAGKERWLQISSYPRLEGECIVADGFIFDITTRKEAEQKLTIEKKRLQALDHMPDGVLYRSVRDMRTGKLIFDYLSGTWEEIMGVSAEDTFDDLQNVFEHMPVDDLKMLMQHINELDSTRKKFNIEVRYNHPVTLEEHWFQISSYPRREGDHIISDGFIFDITTRKKAEKKLLAEKERLEALGNNLPDGVLFQIVRVAQTGQIRMSFVSGRWEKITGIPSDVVISGIDVLFALIHPDDLPLVMEELDKSARTMTNFYVEFRISVQGHTRWIQMKSHPNCQDSLIVWDGIMLDITIRKEVEHELKTEKKRLQMLGDNIPGSTLFQFSRDTRTGQMRMLYVSGTWETVTGVAAKTAMSNISKVFDVVEADDLPAFIQSIDDSARTVTDLEFETRFGELWMNIIARPRREGVHIIWDGIITNITGHKEAERELRAEKNRIQTMSDNLHNSSLYQFVRDSRTRQMRLSYVSASWEAVTGIAAEVALADVTKVFSEVPPEDFPVFLQSIEESARTMTVYKFEIRLGERWMHLVARPRQEETVIVWDGIITDITERKETETELVQYREKLEYLVQERTDELNTANEELYATNEELYATNETLYTTNKELDNYKEQLEEMVKQKTQELEQSHHAMRAVLDNIDIHILVTDFEDYKILFANRKAKELFGDVDGQTCWKVIQKDMTGPCDFCPKVHLFDKNSRPTGVYLWEQKNLLNNEWYCCRDAAVQWFDGRLVHLEYATNITERKNNEAELIKYRDNLESLVKERTDELNSVNTSLMKALSEDKYQLAKLDLLVEASGIGLWDMQVVKGDPTNPNNTIVWSDEFRKLLGYSNEEDFPNKLNSWSNKLHPDDKERLLDAFTAHLLDRTGNTPYNIEYRLLKKNGEYARFKAFGATIRDEEGNALRVAGAIQEIPS